MVNIIFVLCFISFLNGSLAKSIQNDTVDNRIAVLEKLVDKLEARINKTENSVDESNDHKRAVFHARMTTSKTLNIYSVIQFNTVIINEGGHYNPADGVFVAPVSGVYMFAWSTLTYGGNQLFTELRVDGSVKGSIGNSAASSQYTPGSMSVICHVKQGNHVWIQTSSVTSSNYIYDWSNYNLSFMGFLLYKD